MSWGLTEAQENTVCKIESFMRHNPGKLVNVPTDDVANWLDSELAEALRQISSIEYPNQPVKQPKPVRPAKPEKLTINERFSYNPETGVISDLRGKMGTFNVMKGYGYIHHNGKTILLHRLAWYLMTGSFPEVQIYHLNGDKQDNRWPNLSLKRERAISYRAQVRVGDKIVYLGCYPTIEARNAVVKKFRESLDNVEQCATM